MSRTHLSLRVDLVSGRGRDYWPRPGRVFLVGRTMTFGVLAEAVDVAFGRWDLAHLHTFDLTDGTLLIGPGATWDDPPQGRPVERSAAVRLSRLGAGEQFAYTFDMGDDWTHLCTVDESRVDPYEVYGALPTEPVPLWGWGELPDQYGRRFDGDTDDDEALPRQPKPPTSDLPPILPWWGAK